MGKPTPASVEGWAWSWSRVGVHGGAHGEACHQAAATQSSMAKLGHMHRWIIVAAWIRQARQVRSRLLLERLEHFIVSKRELSDPLLGQRQNPQGS